jgi:signal transduction histidine kinase
MSVVRLIGVEQNQDKPLPVDLLSFAKEEREYLHDLANPLAIATGMLEALQEDLSRSDVKLSEGQARKLSKIQTALERIGGLVRDRRARMIAIQEKNGTKP